MKSKSCMVRVELSGVNINRIYKECQNLNIDIFDIKRVDYKNIQFNIDKKNINHIKDISKKHNYKCNIIKKFGIAKFIFSISSRIGIWIGLLLFFVVNILSMHCVWNIKIYGNSRVSSDQILFILSNNGINNGIVKKVNYDLVEQEILNSIEEISLCSIIKKGSTIIVNIKEKLFVAEMDSERGADIIASQNMTIKSLNLIQGTALKKEGDSVKKGEVIVAGYFMDANGDKVSCRANANITATIWYSHSEIYKKEKEIFIRTGNKISNSYMCLNGNIFNVKNIKNTFESYDIETNEEYVFNNNFIPIKLVTTTYFETEKSIVQQNFDVDKNKIIELCKQKTLEKVPENLSIVNTFETVLEEEKEFIVTAYVEIDIQI